MVESLQGSRKGSGDLNIRPGPARSCPARLPNTFVEKATILSDSPGPRTPRKRGRKPDLKKHAAVQQLLEANPTLSAPQIAKMAGVSDHLVYRAKAALSAAEKAQVELFKENLADLTYEKAQLILDSITPEKLEKLSGDRAALAYCQLVDKARLVSGKSTQNIAHLHAFAQGGAKAVEALLGHQSVAPGTPVVEIPSESAQVEPGERIRAQHPPAQEETPSTVPPPVEDPQDPGTGGEVPPSSGPAVDHLSELPVQPTPTKRPSRRKKK